MAADVAANVAIDVALMLACRHTMVCKGTTWRTHGTHVMYIKRV